MKQGDVPSPVTILGETGRVRSRANLTRFMQFWINQGRLLNLTNNHDDAVQVAIASVTNWILAPRWEVFLDMVNWKGGGKKSP